MLSVIRPPETQAPEVLVVDDDPEVRDAIRDVLEDEGFLVRCAGNGKEALDALSGETLPDAIILDLTMPIMDGYEFLQRRERIAEMARIPVIVVTASMNPPLEEDVAFVRKPIDIELLMDAVRTRVRR